MTHRGRVSWYCLPHWDRAGGRAPKGRGVGAVSDDVTRGPDNADTPLPVAGAMRHVVKFPKEEIRHRDPKFTSSGGLLGHEFVNSGVQSTRGMLRSRGRCMRTIARLFCL